MKLRFWRWLAVSSRRLLIFSTASIRRIIEQGPLPEFNPQDFGHSSTEEFLKALAKTKGLDSSSVKECTGTVLEDDSFQDIHKDPIMITNFVDFETQQLKYLLERARMNQPIDVPDDLKVTEDMP